MPFRVLACTARESAAKAARQDTTNSVNSDAELCARLHQLLQHLPGAVTAGSGSSDIDLYRLEALQPSLGLERSSVWVAGEAGIGHADDGVQPYGDVLWSKITFKAVVNWAYGDVCMVVRIGKAGDQLAYPTVAELNKVYEKRQ